MTNDPVRRPGGGDGRPDSGMRPRVPTELALRYHGNDLPIHKREVVIGRGAECDVMLSSVLVSRRHARFVVGSDAISIEDLGSRNGVLVNGQQIEGAHSVFVGDRIDLADEVLELVRYVPPDARRSSETQANLRAQRSPSEPPESIERTRKASAFVLLGGLLDKLVALGRGEEAERLMSTHLTKLLAEVRQGARPETLTTAGHYAVRLADATSKADWVDYVVELYTLAEQPMPTPQIDTLHVIVRKVSGVSIAKLRAYVELLRELAGELGPSERFALRRIESLLDVAQNR